MAEQELDDITKQKNHIQNLIAEQTALEEEYRVASDKKDDKLSTAIYAVYEQKENEKQEAYAVLSRLLRKRIGTIMNNGSK